MKEGQETLAIEVTGEKEEKKDSKGFENLNAPTFMIRNRARKEVPTRKEELKNIKVNRASQNNWELLKKLDELVGLILAGEEPIKADIQYTIVNNDKYRKERNKGFYSSQKIIIWVGLILHPIIF